MSEELTTVIMAQTKILFANIEATMEAMSDSQLHDTRICDWTLGEQLFHAVHSMDKWFINPRHYEEPERFAPDAGRRLSRSELTEYYGSIKSKIMAYLQSLQTKELGELPRDCRFSKLTLILGQYRHLMYPIHGCLRVSSRGETPAYVGLSQIEATGSG